MKKSALEEILTTTVGNVYTIALGIKSIANTLDFVVEKIKDLDDRVKELENK